MQREKVLDVIWLHQKLFLYQTVSRMMAACFLKELHHAMEKKIC